MNWEQLIDSSKCSPHRPHIYAVSNGTTSTVIGTEKKTVHYTCSGLVSRIFWWLWKLPLLLVLLCEFLIFFFEVGEYVRELCDPTDRVEFSCSTWNTRRFWCTGVSCNIGLDHTGRALDTILFKNRIVCSGFACIWGHASLRTTSTGHQVLSRF